MSRKKSTGEATAWETVRLSLRGYRIWWKENPKLLLSTAAYVLFEALTPYVGIWFWRS